MNSLKNKSLEQLIQEVEALEQEHQFLFGDLKKLQAVVQAKTETIRKYRERIAQVKYEELLAQGQYDWEELLKFDDLESNYKQVTEAVQKVGCTVLSTDGYFPDLEQWALQMYFSDRSAGLLPELATVLGEIAKYIKPLRIESRKGSFDAKVIKLMEPGLSAYLNMRVLILDDGTIQVADVDRLPLRPSFESKSWLDVVTFCQKNYNMDADRDSDD